MSMPVGHVRSRRCSKDVKEDQLAASVAGMAGALAAGVAAASANDPTRRSPDSATRTRTSSANGAEVESQSTGHLPRSRRHSLTGPLIIPQPYDFSGRAVTESAVGAAAPSDSLSFSTAAPFQPAVLPVFVGGPAFTDGVKRHPSAGASGGRRSRSSSRTHGHSRSSSPVTDGAVAPMPMSWPDKTNSVFALSPPLRVPELTDSPNDNLTPVVPSGSKAPSPLWCCKVVGLLMLLFVLGLLLPSFVAFMARDEAALMRERMVIRQRMSSVPMPTAFLDALAPQHSTPEEPPPSLPIKLTNELTAEGEIDGNKSADLKPADQVPKKQQQQQQQQQQQHQANGGLAPTPSQSDPSPSQPADGTPEPSVKNDETEQRATATLKPFELEAIRIATAADPRPELHPNYAHHWTQTHLRAREKRDRIASALRVLDQGWRDEMSAQEREAEESFWSEAFETPERYTLTSTELFPNAAKSETGSNSAAASSSAGAPAGSRDSSGYALRISGRYPGDPVKDARDLDRHSNHAFHYQLCTFTNVCLSSAKPDKLLFHFTNLTQHLTHEERLARCAGGRLNKRGVGVMKDDKELRALCSCFHAAFVPTVRPYEYESFVSEKSAEARELLQAAAQTSGSMSETEVKELRKRIDALPAEVQLPPASATRSYPDPFAHVTSAGQGSDVAAVKEAGGGGRDHSHYWGVNKWVNIHHLAHWAQKLLMFQSVMQHSHTFYAPTVARVEAARHEAKAGGNRTAGSSDEAAHRTFAPDLLLPPLTGLLFHDSDARTSEHEETVLDLSLQAGIGAVSRAHTAARAQGAQDKQQKEPAAPQFLQRHHWYDDSGAVIWNSDISAGKYTTSLPPLPMSSASTASASSLASVRWDGMELGALRPPPAAGAPAPPEYTCFKRLSFTPTYGELSFHSRDTLRWRAVMRRSQALRMRLDALLAAHGNAQARAALAPQTGSSLLIPRPIMPVPSPTDAPAMQLSEDKGLRGSAAPPAISSGGSSGTGCPPRRITMLWRENRRILNYAALLDLIAHKYGLSWTDPRPHDKAAPSHSDAQGPVASGPDGHPPAPAPLVQLHYTTLNGSTSSLDQQVLFGSSGLILSSHSSQLINVLFSPRQAAFIEITPEFYNNDFARYAVGMGLSNYNYMLGGCEMEGDNSGRVAAQPEHEACVSSLNAACTDGDGRCIMHKCYSLCVPSPSALNKNLNFRVVDLARFERVLDRTVALLDQRCKEAGVAEGWLAGFKREREEWAHAQLQNSAKAER